MSDFDSPAETPRPEQHRSPKRRRIYDDSGDSTPRRYSSGEDEAPRSSTRRARRSSNDHERSRSRSRDYERRDDEYDSRRQSRSRSRHGSRSRASSRGSHRSSRSTPGPESPPKRVSLQLDYKPRLVLEGHTKGVSQVKFSPDGKWIASCSADATIKVWDAVTGQHLRTIDGHLAGVSTIAWSPDSSKIASGSDDKIIRVWHRASGKPCGAPLTGHHNYVYAIAISPKGNILVSGSYDESLMLWDLRRRKKIQELPAHSDPVSGLDFTSDGTLVVSCSTDGLIRIWDTISGQCLRTILYDNIPGVVSVRFSPNGRYVLANTLDSTVRLWDYASGLCRKTYTGHVNVKYPLGSTFGYGPPGSEGFIVSGSEDGELVFWDTNTKEIVQRKRAHKGVVLWVDTSPKVPGKLVTCGLDGKVLIWVDGNEDVDGLEESVARPNGVKQESVDEMEGVQMNGATNHKTEDTQKAEDSNGVMSVEASTDDGGHHSDRMEE